MDSKRFFTLQNHSKVSDVTHLKTMRDILCFYSLTDAARKFNSKGFTGRIHLYSKFKLNLTVHNAINEQRIGRKPTFLLSSLGRGCHSYGVAGGAVYYKRGPLCMQPYAFSSSLYIFCTVRFCFYGNIVRCFIRELNVTTNL